MANRATGGKDEVLLKRTKARQKIRSGEGNLRTI